MQNFLRELCIRTELLGPDDHRDHLLSFFTADPFQVERRRCHDFLPGTLRVE
jgi:hypothetical protein